MDQHEHGPTGDQPAHDAAEQPARLAPEAEPQPTSGMAITAMILGLVSIPLACVGVGIATGIVALILGIIAMGQTGDPPFKMKGKGMAVTGLILGILAVLVAPIALMIGILLPALGAARNTARQIQNSTQLRGIHQGMVIYAQSNKVGSSSPAYYPGLDAQGNPVDLSVEGRFAELLDGNYFTPDYLLNPADDAKTEYNYAGNFSSQHYSYATLEIAEPGGRRDEWRETLNTQAVILTDRNTNPYGQAESVWSDQGWRGGVARNDNSVGFESSEIIPQTRYGSHPANQNDDLFNATGNHDALLIHEGERQ